MNVHTKWDKERLEIELQFIYGLCIYWRNKVANEIMGYVCTVNTLVLFI
jgi:hypothetical protein